MDVNLNELADLNTKQRAGTSGFLAGQNTTSADYLKRYSDFINGQEGASAMAGRLGTELGIPTLQANATMLRNTLTNLPSTYSKASQGYEINNNQLQRIIGQKSSELSPMVQTAETSLAGARSDLNTRMGYETLDQTRQEKPYTLEQTMLATRQARETTLYSQENEAELNALISKLQMGVTLSEGEKSRAATLAASEQSYQNQLEINKQNNANKTTTPNTQIVESNGRKYLIDSGTGKIISTYGTSTSGSGTAPVLGKAPAMGSSGGQPVTSTFNWGKFNL